MVYVYRGDTVFCVAAVSGDKISKAVSLISKIITSDSYVGDINMKLKDKCFTQHNCSGGQLSHPHV